MKNMVFVLFVFLSAGVVAGESLLASGSKIVIQSYSGDPVASGGVSFRDTERNQYSLRIEANGDRNYLLGDGSIHHGNSADHTTLIWNGKAIPGAKRFARLPPGGKLQSGMEWDASVVGGTSCGDMPFEYNAKSSEGTPFTLQMNGNPQSFRTIRIEYRASVRICAIWNALNPNRHWERKQVILFAPALNEIVESTTWSFNWRSSPNANDESRFVDGAHGWRIVEIRQRQTE